MDVKKISLWIIISLFLLIPQVHANQLINGNYFTIYQRTKSDIISRWQTGKLDFSGDIFERSPSYQNPYDGGVVKQSYLDNVLSNLNYYRYLVGSPQIVTKPTQRDDLQKAMVVQYLSLQAGKPLTHNLSGVFPRPNDMDVNFYNTAVGAPHNIIMRNDYKTPIFPFFDESAFITMAGHRVSLLAPSVIQADFGLGNVTYGDTKFQDVKSYNNNMTTSFVAYPSPGYFPIQDFAYLSDWDIYLNNNQFAYLSDADQKKIVATIENLETHEITEYSIAKNNMYFRSVTDVNSSQGTAHYGPYILLKQPTKNLGRNYIGAFKVTIKNLKNKSNNLVDITYTVNFFNKYEMDSTPEDVNDIKYRQFDNSDYNFGSLTWEREFDKDLIKLFLPKKAVLELNNESLIPLDVTFDEIISGDVDYLAGFQYHAKPSILNVPDYINDLDSHLKSLYINHIDSNDYSIKVQADREKYDLNSTAKLSYTSSNFLESNYHFSWYRLNDDNTLTKIDNSSHYQINGTNLTINNFSKEDEGEYLIVSVPKNGMIGFSTTVSSGVKIKLETYASSLSFVDPISQMEAYDEVQFAVTLYPQDVTNTDIKWSIDNQQIATIDANGKLKALKAGKVTVTASTIKGVKVSHTVIINEPLKGDVNLNKKIELNDVVTAMSILIEQREITDKILYVGDIDQDGMITMNDVTLIAELWMKLNFKITSTTEISNLISNMINIEPVVVAENLASSKQLIKISSKKKKESSSDNVLSKVTSLNNNSSLDEPTSCVIAGIVLGNYYK